MNKIVVILIFITIMISACGPKPNDKGEYVINPGGQAKEIRIKYDKNGGIEYIKEFANGKPEGLYMNFHENQNPDNLAFIKNDKNTGTGVVFHKSGQLNNFGQYTDGEKTGWFYVFNKSSELICKREYILLDGKSYLNQWIEYDDNGMPDKRHSSYLGINAEKDTIKKGDTYQLNISLEASYLKQYMLLVIGPFDEKYHLPANAACDTISSNNYMTKYTTKTYKHGENIIRGMVQEIRLKKQDDASYNVRKIYFTKEFFVQ